MRRIHQCRPSVLVLRIDVRPGQEVFHDRFGGSRPAAREKRHSCAPKQKCPHLPPNFNPSDYQIKFTTYDSETEENPLVHLSQKGDVSTFVITNTAEAAQIGFLRHQEDENNILLHSQYTRQDKAYWFEQVYESFRVNKPTDIITANNLTF